MLSTFCWRVRPRGMCPTKDGLGRTQSVAQKPRLQRQFEPEGGTLWTCYRAHLGPWGHKVEKSPKMSPQELSAPGVQKVQN